MHKVEPSANAAIPLTCPHLPLSDGQICMSCYNVLHRAKANGPRDTVAEVEGRMKRNLDPPATSARPAKAPRAESEVDALA